MTVQPTREIGPGQPPERLAMPVQVVLLDDPSWAQPIAGGRAVIPPVRDGRRRAPDDRHRQGLQVEMRAKTAQRLGLADQTRRPSAGYVDDSRHSTAPKPHSVGGLNPSVECR